MTGWIIICDEANAKSEVEYLKGLGVVITAGPQRTTNDGDLEVYVEVSDSALTKLNEDWGRFYWGLK